MAEVMAGADAADVLEVILSPEGVRTPASNRSRGTPSASPAALAAEALARACLNDSSFARLLEAEEMAAVNPWFERDRSLALAMARPPPSGEDGFDSAAPAAEPAIGGHPAADGGARADAVHALLECARCATSVSAAEACAIDACAHSFCVRCVREHVLAELARESADAAVVSCPLSACEGGDCAALLSGVEARAYGGAPAYERALERQTRHVLAHGGERLVTCPTCTAAAAVHPSTPRSTQRRAASEAPRVAENGSLVKTPARLHFVTHRFRCATCAAEFCGSCGAAPYHLGLSCEAWEAQQRRPSCRFCAGPVPAAGAESAAAAAQCQCAPQAEPDAGADGAPPPLARLGGGAANDAARGAAAARGAPGAKRLPAAAAARGINPHRLWRRVLDSRAAGRAARAAHAEGGAARRLGRGVRAGPAPAAVASRGCARVVARGAGWQTCCRAECAQRGTRACTAALACGHPCLGVRGEAPCLGCLRPGCAPPQSAAELFCAPCAPPAAAPAPELPEPPRPAEAAPAAAAPPAPAVGACDDLCAICWSEELQAAPSIALRGCGHTLHLHCVETRLQQRWSGASVSYEYLRCPLCKGRAEHPAIEEAIGPHRAAEAALRSRALERLHYDGLAAAPELVRPGGRFYKRPVEFALSRYSYYECYKCKQPYYAGLAECAAQHRARDGFDPREQVCGGCSAQPGERVVCRVHGRSYIEYKCRFCCRVATWFCWGDTHFCDACHAISSTVAAQPCTCGKPHPPNGKEHALGCAICHAISTF